MYKQENKRQAKAGNHCPTCYDSFEMDFIHWKIQLLFKKIYFLEREGEKHECVAASHRPPMGTRPTTQACALDWESNRRPFDLQASTQPLSYSSQGKKKKKN